LCGSKILTALTLCTNTDTLFVLYKLSAKGYVAIINIIHFLMQL
jgi:hypothetical protein